MKNRKGFTLIEIIVVLIIIAILAAIAVPAMMKYINDAKEKQIMAEMRTVAIAMQTTLMEFYAEDMPASVLFPMNNYDNGPYTVSFPGVTPYTIDVDWWDMELAMMIGGGGPGNYTAFGARVVELAPDAATLSNGWSCYFEIIANYGEGLIFISRFAENFDQVNYKGMIYGYDAINGIFYSYEYK